MKVTVHKLTQMLLFQFRSLYRNKIAFFFNLVFPLLMVATFGAMFGLPRATPSKEPIGWVDLGGGAASRELGAAVEALGRYTLVTGDEASLITALQQGDVRTVVVLPSEFDDRIEKGDATATVRVLYDPKSPRSNEVMVDVRQVLDSVDATMQGARPRLSVQSEVYADEAQVDTFDYLMPGQMSVMLLSAGLVTVSITIASQRARGAMRHLFSTPLSISAWVGSRILANAVMAGLQCMLLFAFAGLVFGVAAPNNVLGTAVVVLISTFASLGMGILVGTFVKSEESAMAITMPLFMVLIFLGDAAMPLQDPPAFISALLPYVPSHYMTNALRAVMMHGAGLGTILRELMILSGIAVVLFTISLRRLRQQYIVV